MTFLAARWDAFSLAHGAFRVIDSLPPGLHSRDLPGTSLSASCWAARCRKTCCCTPSKRRQSSCVAERVARHKDVADQLNAGAAQPRRLSVMLTAGSPTCGSSWWSRDGPTPRDAVVEQLRNAGHGRAVSISRNATSTLLKPPTSPKSPTGGLKASTSLTTTPTSRPAPNPPRRCSPSRMTSVPTPASTRQLPDTSRRAAAHGKPAGGCGTPARPRGTVRVR